MGVVYEDPDFVVDETTDEVLYIYTVCAIGISIFKSIQIVCPGKLEWVSDMIFVYWWTDKRVTDVEIKLLEPSNM